MDIETWLLLKTDTSKVNLTDAESLQLEGTNLLIKDDKVYIQEITEVSTQTGQLSESSMSVYTLQSKSGTVPLTNSNLFYDHVPEDLDHIEIENTITGSRNSAVIKKLSNGGWLILSTVHPPLIVLKQ